MSGALQSADPGKSHGWPLNEDGVWLQVAEQRTATKRPGLFLDRDGVLVEEVEHLHRLEDICMLDGMAKLVARANRAAVPVALVTNQSGIAREMYGWSDFAAVQSSIEERLAASGADLDAVAACPFHPDFTPDYGAVHAAWRKPGPAMVSRIADMLALDLRKSWLIGDTASDVGAARNAGLAGAVIVMTGHGRRDREAALALARPGFTVLAAEGAEEAAHHLDPLLMLSPERS